MQDRIETPSLPSVPPNRSSCRSVTSTSKARFAPATEALVLSSQPYAELCASLKSLTFRKYSFKHLDCNDYEYTIDEEAEIDEWHCRQAMGDDAYQRMMEGCEEGYDYG